ncbi:transcriptional regulator [Microvirga tunisiensis]|uniref:Transcriptional regulator n=2 Tax=Pannonibacter tanglangensis TaxID=2750084 RepID=A0A7X5EZ53_9HYPH|nr:MULTISPECIES: transcriptional regulator [unclassified Pannonibacter]NBN63174.1 transcriptional regulator [Pannonibacter sp. XCT-34]NBN76738.1 transcriptional regulator [Pannonibacter sp. XCT-53]
MSYHYKASGLDNIVLVNGYRIEQDPDYGELVHIEDIHGLHRAIARRLISMPRPLTGAEFRFLRTCLDMSQPALALSLGSTEQNIRNWEVKGRTVPVANQPADRLLRVLVLARLFADESVGEFLDQLAGGNTGPDEPLELQHARDVWLSAA